MSMSDRSLKSRTVRGGTVTVLSQIVRFGITTGSTIVLARLLTPQDYGLVAMVTSVVGILRILADAGLSTATVQRSSVSHQLISTVFWINVSLGAVTALLVTAGAPLLARFYKEPRLLAIACWLASTFVIDAAGAQHQALLRRDMRFTALAVVDLCSLLAGLATGLLMAFHGFGFWSLVGMQVVSTLISTLASWLVQPWRPGLPRRNTGVRSMARFGAFLTGSNVLNYLFRNADNVLIGWRWGALPLGLYQKAYGLLMLPINQINAPISNVAVSALSRVQSDPPSQRRYFIRGYTIAVSITLPLILGATVFAPEVIQFLLGDKWLAAVPLFRLLAPAALVGALLNPFGWLFISTGRADRQMRAGAVWAGAILLAFAVGLRFGPAGVALGFSIMSLLLAVPICAYAVKGTAVSLRDVGGALTRPSLAALASGCIVVPLKSIMPVAWPAGVLAVGGSLVSLLVYSFVLMIVMGQWRHYRDIIGHVFSGRSHALA